MEKTPFWKKTWFIVLMFLIVPPLGIALMWGCKRDWNKTIKIVLSAVLAFWTLIWGIMLLAPADEPSEQAGETESTQEEVTEPSSATQAATDLPVVAVTQDETTTAKEETTTAKPTTTKEETTTAKPTTTKKETTTAKPTTTKKETTVPQNTGTKYILNTNTYKFHYPSCGSAKKIADYNRDEFYGDRQTLIDRGYAPCGNCHP